MSFEIKYDRDGVALRNQPELKTEPEIMVDAIVVADPEPESVIESPEIVEDAANDVVEEAAPVAVAKSEEKSSPKESWKAIRDRMALAEKKADDLEKALFEEKSRKKSSSEPEEDLSLDIQEDELAEGKHLKKMDKRYSILEQRIKQYEQEAAQNALIAKVKMQYPDWDAVYNEENLARLEVQEPDIYKALNSSSDSVRAGISAYKMIKQMVVMPTEDLYAHDKALAQKNSSKPKSLASISPQQGDSPLSKANAFANGTVTDDLKKNLWKEMNDARKGY